MSGAKGAKRRHAVGVLAALALLILANDAFRGLAGVGGRRSGGPGVELRRPNEGVTGRKGQGASSTSRHEAHE